MPDQVKLKTLTKCETLTMAVAQFAVEQFVLFLQCSDLLLQCSDALFEPDDLRVFGKVAFL
jgi:hypothetical protein